MNLSNCFEKYLPCRQGRYHTYTLFTVSPLSKETDKKINADVRPRNELLITNY